MLTSWRSSSEDALFHRFRIILSLGTVSYAFYRSTNTEMPLWLLYLFWCLSLDSTAAMLLWQLRPYLKPAWYESVSRSFELICLILRSTAFSTILVKCGFITIGLISDSSTTLDAGFFDSGTSLPLRKYSGKHPLFSIAVNSLQTFTRRSSLMSSALPSKPSGPIPLSKLHSVMASSTSLVVKRLQFSAYRMIYSRF